MIKRCIAESYSVFQEVTGKKCSFVLVQVVSVYDINKTRKRKKQKKETGEEGYLYRHLCTYAATIYICPAAIFIIIIIVIIIESSRHQIKRPHPSQATLSSPSTQQ